jgi:3-oxoacyl-(acyl-carrier-protein) synthase
VVGSLGLDQDINLFVEALRSSLDSDRRFSYTRFQRQGTALIDPLFLLKSLPNAGLCGAAIEFGLRGPNLNIMNGQVSGLLAVAIASRMVAAGECDVAIAGGYDSTLQFEVALSHLLNGHLSTKQSPDRGYVLGEGAAFFVIESESHARSRGATVFAEITGVGHSHSRPTHAPQGLSAAARAAFDSGAPGAIYCDGLNLPASDRMEQDAAELIGCDAGLQSSTHLIGYCGVASPLFSLLDAVLHLSGDSLSNALVWTSDRRRDHVAVSLHAVGREWLH